MIVSLLVLRFSFRYSWRKWKKVSGWVGDGDKSSLYYMYLFDVVWRVNSIMYMHNVQTGTVDAFTHNRLRQLILFFSFLLEALFPWIYYCLDWMYPSKLISAIRNDDVGDSCVVSSLFVRKVTSFVDGYQGNSNRVGVHIYWMVSPSFSEWSSDQSQSRIRFRMFTCLNSALFLCAANTKRVWVTPFRNMCRWGELIRGNMLFESIINDMME